MLFSVVTVNVRRVADIEIVSVTKTVARRRLNRSALILQRIADISISDFGHLHLRSAYVAQISVADWPIG